MTIYEAIPAIMAEIGAVKKDKKNTQQNYLFRGVDDVMNTLKPILAKYHVFIVPEVLEQTREERRTPKGSALVYSILKIKYTFYAEDGSSVTAVMIGEGMDSGDKATNKAESVAYKYACFQVFSIPTEDMTDPDAESHEVAPREPQLATANATGAVPLAQTAPREATATDAKVSEAERKKLAKMCTDKWGNDANRRYKEVTGLTHMNLTKSQYADVLTAVQEAE